MAIKQITEITCDVCGKKMDNRYGVSIETGESPPCVEADRPAHEIELCHKCACMVVFRAVMCYEGFGTARYRKIMDDLFSEVKRIDNV